MSLNENSTRRDILNWIKTDPFYFLHNFSDKSWAQPYIDEAAKRAAKEESFLYQFSDEHKRKLNETRKGRKHSNESKQKMSEAIKAYFFKIKETNND